jgi:hypothetical protein
MLADDMHRASVVRSLSIMFRQCSRRTIDETKRDILPAPIPRRKPGLSVWKKEEKKIDRGFILSAELQENMLHEIRWGLHPDSVFEMIHGTILNRNYPERSF